jgi:pyruvate-formate lyase-activating enzyme
MVDAAGWRALTALPRRTASPDSAVAWRGGEPLSQAAFAAQVAAWRDTLAAVRIHRVGLFAG